MIFDRMENLDKYEIEFLKPVIEYIKNTGLENAATGFTEIDGKKLTLSVVDRILDKEPEVWEVHKKYIDVQIVISGRERICFASEQYLKKTLNYEEEKDCALYTGSPDNKISYELSSGDVMIFLPGEIHLPNGPCGKDSVKKAIFKVLKY